MFMAGLASECFVPAKLSKIFLHAAVDEKFYEIEDTQDAKKTLEKNKQGSQDVQKPQAPLPKAAVYWSPDERAFLPGQLVAKRKLRDKLTSSRFMKVNSIPHLVWSQVAMMLFGG